MEEKREDKAIILTSCRTAIRLTTINMFRKTAIAQASNFDFSLLELILKKEFTLKTMQVVYIGEGKREEVHHVSGKPCLKS